MVTTLGLLGLMHELYENISGGNLRGNTLSYRIPNRCRKPLLKRGMIFFIVDKCFGNWHCMLLMSQNKEIDFSVQLCVLLYSHKIYLPRLKMGLWRMLLPNINHLHKFFE
jgi:hypothetical protein